MYGDIHTIYCVYTVDWPVQRPSVLENQLPERGNSSKTRLNHKRVRVLSDAQIPFVIDNDNDNDELLCTSMLSPESCTGSFMS